MRGAFQFKSDKIAERSVHRQKFLRQQVSLQFQF